jgi:hypothetical protein
MQKTTTMSEKDLAFVRKYCLGSTYPANYERCLYVEGKIRHAGAFDFEEVDVMYLCLYPDEKIPTHGSPLTSELKQCPNRERRKKIDALRV